MLDFITVHANFMTSNNSLKAVLLAELLGDVGTELHPHTSLTWATTGFFLRIGPQHLHHQTSLTRLSLVVSVQFADVVQSHAVIREQAAVEDKILFANECSQRQGGERLGEELEGSVQQLALGLKYKLVLAKRTFRYI